MKEEQRFAPDALEVLERMDEVRIEPSREGQAVKPVIIWVVVVDGQVYVRSARGAAGHWYQALLRRPQGTLHAGRVRIPFRAQHVSEPDTVAHVNEAYQRKYGHKWPAETESMLVEDVVPTTLRLEPIE
jgi:hypothetical protein